MQKEKNAQPNDSAHQGGATTKDERFAEATSSETLADVRADAKLTDKDSTARDVSTIPAPDGTATIASGSDGRADGSDTGEPM